MTATTKTPPAQDSGTAPTATSKVSALLADRRLPVLVTAALFLAMYVTGLSRYQNYGFGEPQVFLNLFIDNGYLLVAAVGATFVILSGGIDLSVGSVIGFTTMFTAWLVERQGLPILLVIPMALAVGAFGGFLMGYVIQNFEIQPFIVTLAGLFLFRGLCLVISKESIAIGDATVSSLAQAQAQLGIGFLSVGAIVALVVLAAAFYILHYSRFGRRVYAIGGNEQSAMLMGLPQGGTKIAVYTVSGFCSALAGLLFTLYIQSGDPLHATGMELDAIAAVVIGGTLLTGGSGYVLGTLFGVLVLGLIKSIIQFEGTLSSWWTKIATGVLLCAFILIQRAMTARKKT
ncbi:galactofuranose ABC transporter, permease protein YjfF [Streptomyces europaeiscabiei]|uniref:Sugar ABC transporter permease YjfF n=1 Tax=Streptomyces europaeiscabiei TaxID=146819 RepID=A0ABU4NBQ1_9ACTN|nr:galactofuranose ABC transporter, permease protein YjfF [Streptomyces europaeiscabiei]MDX2523962.1 sugar ABC transporter permease YjfF [Streptomyces europaeiscabiei]MDX3545236.1 sugar ABC transporter permease YjfF [Streptomyces europaeiscabiei]MDX3554227.1 sugar ABC transporter permease YjfF [Streptomyces europaeiscabiei]MDX3699522.1 sugar ABC transporter permease YjfF [Streptomyces europaeiscabiei]